MGYPRSENIRRLTRWLELSVRFLEFPFFISPRTSGAAAKKKSGNSYKFGREGGCPLGSAPLRGSFGRLLVTASGSSFRPGARQQTPIRTALVKVDQPCCQDDTSAEFRRGRAPGGTLAGSETREPFFFPTKTRRPRDWRACAKASAFTLGAQKLCPRRCTGGS